MQTIAQFVGGQSDDADAGFRYSGLARIHHIEDGDTLYASYRADPSLRVGKPASRVAPDGVSEPGIWVRLPAVDTHETDADDEQKRQQAKQEMQFVQSFVEQGRSNASGECPFLVAYTGEDFEGSFGRRLADVIRRSDGESLSGALLSEFDGIKYQG